MEDGRLVGVGERLGVVEVSDAPPDHPQHRQKKKVDRDSVKRVKPQNPKHVALVPDFDRDVVPTPDEPHRRKVLMGLFEERMFQIGGERGVSRGRSRERADVQFRGLETRKGLGKPEGQHRGDQAAPNCGR